MLILHGLSREAVFFVQGTSPFVERHNSGHSALLSEGSFERELMPRIAPTSHSNTELYPQAREGSLAVLTKSTPALSTTTLSMAMLAELYFVVTQYRYNNFSNR
jgi:hypothetical protein